jgi:hypothetical protein
MRHRQETPRARALEVEFALPKAAPTNASASVSINPNSPGIRLQWSNAVPVKAFSTVEQEDTAGVVTRSAVETQGLFCPRPPTCGAFAWRRATRGCSPPSAWVEFRRPTMSLPPPCVQPQQSRLDGCR